MKKLLCLLLAVCLTVPMFAACGKFGPANESTETTAQTEPPKPTEPPLCHCGFPTGGHMQDHLGGAVVAGSIDGLHHHIKNMKILFRQPYFVNIAKGSVDKFHLQIQLICPLLQLGNNRSLPNKRGDTSPLHSQNRDYP